MVRRLLRAHDAPFLKALLRDSVLAGVAAGLARIFVFALSVVVSRLAGSQEEFGLFSSALVIVQLVSMLASLGLAQTSSQAIAASATDPREQARVVRSMIVTVAGLALLTALLLAGGASLLQQGLASRVPASLIRATSVLVFLQLLSGGLEGVFRGLRAFRVLPLAALVALACAAVIGYPAIVRFGQRGGLMVLGVFLAAQTGVLLLHLRRFAAGPLLAPRALVALLGGVAAPTFLSGLFWNVAMLVPPLLLVRAHAGLVEIAVWNAATQLRTVISFAPIVIVNATIPHLVERLRTSRVTRRQAATAIGAPMVAALLPYLPAVALAAPLMSLYGAEYGRHALLLVLVASYVLLQVLGVGLFGFVLASGRVWSAALLNLVWCVVVLALTPYAIQAGSYALATIYLVSYVPVDVVLGVLALRAIRAPQPTPSAAEPQPSA